MLRPGVMAVAVAEEAQSVTPMTPSRKGCQFVRALTATPNAPLGMLVGADDAPPSA